MKWKGKEVGIKRYYELKRAKVKRNERKRKILKSFKKALSNINR